MAELHDNLLREFGRQTIERVEVPNAITGNLRPKYRLRPYQVEAFQRFILCYSEEFKDKPKPPLHLLFNMATGSGKTLIMAGLILYLYGAGYRDFLFFVNSNNIIRKTKDNFLNGQASKYLFADQLAMDGQSVQVKEVANFGDSHPANINIKFTTIQQLHIDLGRPKENAISLEDFANKKTVLIADEAHHLSAGSRGNGDLLDTWEGTVTQILQANEDNILLEFTATLDASTQALVDKYADKVMFKYDLSQFRVDGYSKEISLLQSDYAERDRIVQALALNLYRQELASRNHINLKPVILFKARRTIKESEENLARFHQLIDSFNVELVRHVRKTSRVPIVQDAFAFFKSVGLSDRDIVKRIQFHFRPENCLSANNDKDTERNQILLNTLEDGSNPIRAVFAVQKLNEGWDVLNLFDIVRLYEGRDPGSGSKPGKTTISEAQLIGRGARYFPFAIDEGQDAYTRKYDQDLAKDLKALEELYYHAKEDNLYISELKRALVATGIYDDNLETKQLRLKDSFKATDLYKTGRVVFNKKIKREYTKVESFADLGVSRANFQYELASGHGRVGGAFSEDGPSAATAKRQRDLSIGDFPRPVVRQALARCPFFHHHRLKRYFPGIGSTTQLMEDDRYLGGLAITFEGAEDRLQAIEHEDCLNALIALLDRVETEIKSHLTEYTSSDYTYDYVHNVFKDKEIRVPKDSERAKGQLELVGSEDWFAYNANYGTSEEKRFIQLFARNVQNVEARYRDIHVLRNERALKIHDELGRAFEPDYLLFCTLKQGKPVVYQVFIEPKGGFLQGPDKWKADYLAKLRADNPTLTIDAKDYRITGAPFYHYENENDFLAALKELLDL